MSESQTTSASNWKVIKDSEARRRGAPWAKVTFTLDFFEFLAVKGLKRGDKKLELEKNI